MIDGDAERRPDSVLPPVAAANRTRLVVCDREMFLQPQQTFVRLLRLAALAQQRIDRGLDRREAGIEAQHNALLVLHHIFVVGVEQENQHRAIDPERRLNHPWTVARLGILIEISEVLAARRRMLIEVVTATLGNAFELAPSERVVVLEVGGAARIMRQLFLGVLMEAQVLALGAELQKPVAAMLDPVVEPPGLFGLIRLDEVLHFHLFELAGAKDKILRRDFVAERLAHLRDAERQLDSLCIYYICD